MTGQFISFEGPEGSGKSIQILEVAHRIRAMGREVVHVRAPGGTPLCEAIRGLLQHDTAGESPVPRSEVLLFFASHAQLSETVISPALARGCIVLADRYVDSTTAYQGYARLGDPNTVREVGRFAVNGLMPDKTVLLDVDVETGFSQLGEGLDRMESEGLEFHQNVRGAYLHMAVREPDRFAVVDATPPSDVVAKAVWKVLCPIILRIHAP